MQALKAVHDAGVLHSDIELRNVVRRPLDSAVLLVDFELARLKDKNLSEDAFVKEAATEMNALRDLLEGVPSVPDVSLTVASAVDSSSLALESSKVTATGSSASYSELASCK